jgi:hypothetical protein
MTPFFRPLVLGAGLAVGTTGAAYAQDFCGGIGSNGQWIGGDETASDISTAADFQEQMALVLGGNNYVSLFTLSAPTDVRIEAQGRGGGDPVIDVYDAAGAMVVSDDDSGGDGASRAELTLDAGTYCVAMRSFDAAPMTGFVRVGRYEHEALTTGFSDGGYGDGGSTYCDSSTLANQLPFGTPMTGTANDAPYWRFTLDTAMPVVITAENSDADPYITLYSNDGGYIDENDDWDGLNSRLELMSPLEAGNYCIALTALSDSTLPITLTVEELDVEAAMRGSYDRAEAAPPLDGSYPVTALGELKTRQRVDLQNSATATWYSFDVYDGGLVLAEAISVNGEGDPYLVLFDDLGRQIAYNDDTNGLDPLVTARITTGTYLLAVGEYGDGAGSPVRMVIERYVPAR